MKLPRTLAAFAAVAILFPCVAARAQGPTGTFTIINGPGVGATLNATMGVVNGPGAGTNGLLSMPNAACPGTQFHYHGLLVGAADPAPGACGWGQINFPMLPGVAIGLPATVPSVPLTLRINPAAETPVNLTPTTAAGAFAVKFDPALAPYAPLPRRRTLTVAAVWSPSLQQIVADDDAQHATRYSPRPTARLVAAHAQPTAPRRAASPERIVPRALPNERALPDESAWQTIDMTGPQAKPTPPSGIVP